MSHPAARVLDIGDDNMLGLCPDGRRVWLDGPAVPGDRVEFLDGGKSGRITRVLEPAPDRIPAPCPHFEACPGCRLQPLPYERQLELKASKITETLARLGGFREFDFAGVRPSPEPYGTRNKLDFTVEGARMGYNTGGGLLPVAVCPIGHPSLSELIPPLTTWLGAHPRHALHRLMLRVEADRAGVHLLLRGELEAADREELIDFAASRESIRSLSIQGDWKQPWHTLAGDPTLRFKLAGEAHRVSHDQFFQVHDVLADTLVRTAMDWLGECGSRAVLDLFCGAGAFTRPAARLAGHALGVDARPGQGPFLKADLRKGLPRNPKITGRQWDTVITDPPRAGMEKGLVKQIRDQIKPRHILCVGCNPATLARDLQRLCATGAYSLQRVQGFDLFPQTTHVETLAQLYRT